MSSAKEFARARVLSWMMTRKGRGNMLDYSLVSHSFNNFAQK